MIKSLEFLANSLLAHPRDSTIRLTSALHLINIKRVAYQSRPWRDIIEEYGT